jgi:hypothetical protein
VPSAPGSALCNRSAPARVFAMMDKRVVGFVVAIVLTGFGIAGLVFGTIDRMRESRLTSSGAHVDGTVIDTLVLRSQHFSGTGARRSSGSDDVTFVLIVRYPAGEKNQVGRFDCTYLAYLEHKVGSTVPVLYNPQKPGEAQLGGNLNAVSSSYILAGGIAAFLIGALLLGTLILSGRDKYPVAPWEEAEP